MEGRWVQYHPDYCPEAKDAPVQKWDTSHDVSVIRADTGERYRVGRFRHSDTAGEVCTMMNIAQGYGLSQPGVRKPVHLETHAETLQRHRQERADALMAALIRANGHAVKAAEILGVHYTYFCTAFRRAFDMPVREYWQKHHELTVKQAKES